VVTTFVEVYRSIPIAPATWSRGMKCARRDDAEQAGGVGDRIEETHGPHLFCALERSTGAAGPQFIVKGARTRPSATPSSQA
jgi:hypothetical protein